MHSLNIITTDRTLNATWSREMAEDLKYLGQYFEYCFENDIEKNFIEKNFIIEFIDNNIICYSLNSKILRKLKLLKLNNDKVHFLIDKILKNSIVKNTSEILERRLSIEIAREIDKEVIKSLMSYIEDTP